MAKEIINNTERFILVQIDKEGTERSISRFHRKFYNSEMVNHAQDFKSEENAAETLNLLYQLTNKTTCESS